MLASFTSHPCDARIKMGTLSCQGCDGAVEITEGVQDMPVDRTESRVCKHPGCMKFRQRGEYCIKHRKQRAAEALKGAVAPGAVPVDVTVKVEPPAPVVEKKSPANVAPADVFPHMISLLDMFKRKQAAQLDEFIAGLDACTSDLQRLEYAAGRLL